MGSAARRGAALLMLVLLSACGSGVFKQPDVALESVQLGGLGLRGGTLLVNLRVANPNRFSLASNQLRYELAIREPGEPSDTTWVDFANGTYAEDFTVGGRDTARVQIPVEFSYAGLGDAAASVFRTGTFNFRARGAVDVRTPLGTYTVPFQKRGTATLLGVR